MTDAVRGKAAASRGTLSYIKNQVLTVPNAFTAFRFGAGFEILLRVDGPKFVFVLAFLGALSDVADGWLARRLHQETYFGKRFDQITDFVFGFALIYAVYWYEGFTLYNVPIILGVTAFSIGILRLRLKGRAINSSRVSKLRGFVQFAAAVAIIGTHVTFPIPYLETLRALAYTALWFSLYLTWRAYVGYRADT